MNSNKYYTGIVVRVIIIACSALILAFLSFKTNYLYSILVLVVLVTFETWGLIRYILRRRDDIKRMLEYIKENNPTLYFSQSRDYPFNELGYFLNEIGDIVREVRIEKESQLQYMNYIVQHVGIGLLSFDKDGKVDIINQAAKELLGVAEVNSISLLEEVQHSLPETLKQLKTGEQKVIKLKSGERLLQLAIRASVFKIGQKEIRLASLQDIKNELDEKEMDAWQKLIRVMTHEIINSVTPVTSLTSTISGFFRKGDQIVTARDLSDENIREALTGLGYIEDRGKNLIDFVSKFRSLTKLPVPKFEEINVAKLFDGINLLKRDELSANGIVLKCIVLQDVLNLNCDRSLIEHVLINLINNASDSILSKSDDKDKIIEICGSVGEDQRMLITVSDNGTGIPDNLLENIFVPFFTTKEHGSGIGLSLSRQIMKLHGGTISVYSKPGTETIFTLAF
jgi:two-component system, NtrC family, nitrogen regulation sensor histidine kinase NtrY